ncbi:MAG: GNAT family N-acetyltransferase [Thalassobius sp.]|nr:GNAT family N-acetyltransferase [Thalassovita sp.]
MIIKKAQANDADKLSEIAFQSKAYWGYSEQFMESCRAELTSTSQELLRAISYVAFREETIVGFYLLKHLNENSIELEQMFVLPKFINLGIGKALFKHAVATAQKNGYNEIQIQADPYAQQFYEKMGATIKGFTPSQSIKNRMLPQMSFLLK